jgi:hypothetical protein
MPSASVMPTISLPDEAVGPLVRRRCHAPPGAVRACSRRASSCVPPRDSTASSVLFAAVGYRARAEVGVGPHAGQARAIADETAGASSDPERIGAIMTVMASDAGMAYDSSRSATRAISSLAPFLMRHAPDRAIGFSQAASAPAAGDVADYAREERWAQEIVLSLVVGDAVYPAT